MNSQQAQYILTIAEERSISRAAQKLFVTQSSLSQSVKHIERQLGVTLFDRSVSPIALTAAGKIYVDYAKQFQALETELENALADCAAIRKGTLKIGASPFRIHCMLAQSVAEFHREYAGIDMTLRGGVWNDLQEALQKNELDLVIGTGSCDAVRIQSEPLSDERLYLAAAPGHPLLSSCKATVLSADDIRHPDWKLMTAQCITWEEIAAEQILVPQDPEFGRSLLYGIWGNDADNAQIMRVDSLETAFSFVMGGMGLALLPDSLIRFGNYQQHPVYFPLPEETAVRSIQLFTRKNAYHSHASAAYAKCLRRLVDLGTWCPHE